MDALDIRRKDICIFKEEYVNPDMDDPLEILLRLEESGSFIWVQSISSINRDKHEHKQSKSRNKRNRS